MKKIDEATAVLTSMPNLELSDAVTLTTAGVLLARFDKDTEAIALYEAALSRDDSFPGAHILLANALARIGRFADAAGHFEKFIELAPEAKEAAAAAKGLEICRSKAKQ